MAEGWTGAESASFEDAHRALVDDESIQFDFQPVREPGVPEWLRRLGEFLTEIAPVLKILFYVAAGAALLLILYLILRRLTGADWPWRRRGSGSAEEEEEEWRPEEAPARALLSEADALAADRRFSEAAHLLLFRSIEEIERRRPKLVRPALTSRDIAGTPAIPPAPRAAFRAIVETVERSLFGGRDLLEEDWRRCRADYERFAFAGDWR